MADRIERRSLGWLIRSVFEPIASGTAACWAGRRPRSSSPAPSSLPRAVAGGAAVRPRRRAGGGVAADRQRRGGVRDLAPAVAAVGSDERLAAMRAARPRRGAGGDELAVLPGRGPATAVHRRRDRVPRHRYAGRSRGPAPAATCPPWPWRSAGSPRVDRRPAGRPAAGVVFALASCAGFMLYVIPGHRIANTAPDGTTGRAGNSMGGIDQLGAAMIVATLFGITGAAPTLCTRTGCCGASASDCAPRSSPTSPTSSRWPGSRAPRSRCTRSCRPPQPVSAWSSSLR